MDLFKHLTLWHGMLLAGAIAALAVLGFFVGVTRIESHQARQLGGMAPYTSPATPSGTAVVYFSRSGNTALAARHVARRLGAALYPLDAPQYALGLAGLAQSALDANALRNDLAQLPDITPRTIDLAPFNTVWLGAPVWFYSPAPPLWAFVAQHRFDGQHVVLFNTFNSHIGADKIAAFRAQVMASGARSFTHRQVLRGRMSQQLTPQEMLQAIDAEWLDR